MKSIETPITYEKLHNLKVKDKIFINGTIFTGRDAALPKLVKSIKAGKKLINLKGSVIMHTAVSPAGISPTTSNKAEIEETIPFLSKSGVKIHVGKGSLNQETINALNEYNSIFVVTPPAAALLTSKIISKKVVAFKDEGMEAMYELKIKNLPGIIAIAHGKSII